MDGTLARRLVACGYLAALIGGGATVYYALTGAKVYYALTGKMGITPLIYLIDAAILFGLAVGIYLGSRVCAIVAFVYNLASQIVIYRGMGQASLVLAPGQILGTIIFIVLYALGIVGTFLEHNQASIGASPGGEARKR